MEEASPKLFDCPDYLQGKYCHALCNYRHQTEEEKRASKFRTLGSNYSLLFSS
jgi:hypothetical protein